MITTDTEFLIEYGSWKVRELALSNEKLQWIWEEMKQYPSLFSDLTRNNEKVFLDVVTDRFSYWLEVVDSEDKTIGILYVNELYRGIDASIHLLFFDRKPTEKAELVKAMIHLIFDKFPYLHRVTAVIPDLYHATLRLSKRVGFVEEGRKRQSQLIRHQWCDEIILGLLASEV